MIQKHNKTKNKIGNKTRKSNKPSNKVQHHHLLMRLELETCPQKDDKEKVEHMIEQIIKDIQMRNPDVSSNIWRTKLAVSSVNGVGNHALNEVFDPSKTGTSARINQVQSFKSSGFGGRNQDVSTYVLTRGATSIREDVFTGPKIQTVTTGSAAGCLTTTPASQIVSERGNAEPQVVSTSERVKLPGLNMAYMRQQRSDGTVIDNIGVCNTTFTPQTESQFVDYLPSIKRGLGVESREAWEGSPGTQFGSQMPFVCSTVFTQGNAKVSEAAGGLVPKDVTRIDKADRPYNEEFAVLQTSRTGDQVGTSNLLGTRATKVGAALRKIPTGIQHRGPQPRTKMVAEPYQLNNGLRSVPAINNPPTQ
jgi:hypothetical protein